MSASLAEVLRGRANCCATPTRRLTYTGVTYAGVARAGAAYDCVSRGRNPFLEQDFDNMMAVDKGMQSRGWLGVRTNPAEGATITHLHRMLDSHLD
jgi:hypothetical protein